MEIKFRTASIDDLILLKYWDKQAHVLAADPNDDWKWEVELKRRLSWREQLIAELEGHPIGFVQIIDAKAEESNYWQENREGIRAIDIWIGDASDLNKGYGTAMMLLALKRCFDDATVQEVLIDPLTSNDGAIRFYKRLGFEFLEYRWFENDHCHVMVMSRELWETKHFRT